MSKNGPTTTIKAGSVVIPVYWLPSKESFLAKWREGDRERRMRNKNLDDLRKEVRKVAKRISAGAIDLANLSPEQSAMCREAVRRGITVADLDAITAVSKATVRAAADGLLEAKGDTSPGNLRNLKSHLSQLAEDFGDRLITTLSTTELDQWLKDRAPVVRTRLNKRKSLVILWRWARDKGLLPQDRRTAAERTDAPSMRQHKREHVTATWAPEELVEILKVVPATYLPWVVLSAFAGIRTLEIFDDRGGKQQLDWRNIHLDDPEPHIFVPAAVAKTAEKRKVPICDCLRQWLRPLAKKSGPICPPPAPYRACAAWGGRSLTSVIAEATGLAWRSNALRHSYGTYSVIETGSVGRVALRMGNSESIIKNHYLDATRRTAEAAQWFSITPDKVDRSLQVVAKNLQIR